MHFKHERTGYIPLIHGFPKHAEHLCISHIRHVGLNISIILVKKCTKQVIESIIQGIAFTPLFSLSVIC